MTITARMPRLLRGAGGPILGLALVAVIFGILIGARFFFPANLELIARQTALPPQHLA